MSMGKDPTVHIDAIQARLDDDFFAGRWERATDRQRDLLWVIAHVDEPDAEFSISEIVEKARVLLPKPFSSSHASQMLASLIERGLVHKTDSANTPSPSRFWPASFSVLTKRVRMLSCSPT